MSGLRAPAAEFSRHSVLQAAIATVVLSAGAQLVLLQVGFLSVAADDAARVLRAREPFSWSMLIEPDVWLPFDKMVYSWVLGVWNDPVWAPRLATGLAGIAVSVVVVWLASRLFEHSVPVLLTGVVVSIAPHRLLFSVSTMSEIFYLLTVLLAAVLVIDWLESDSSRSLTAAVAALSLGTTIRYEAWMIAAVWGLAIIWWWRRGRLSFSRLVALGALLTIFPTVWILANVASTDSFDFLSITRQQAALAEPTLLRSVSSSALGRFAVDMVWAPMLVIGVLGALKWVLERSWRGTLMWLMFIPLGVVSISTVATASVPFAAPWRLSGLWVLFCVPIAVGMAFDMSRQRPALKWLASIVVLASLVGWTIRDVRLASATELTWAEVELARSLDSSEGDVLVEVNEGDDFDFLDIIAASAKPERYELTIGDDPYLVALLIRRLEEWRAIRPDLVSAHARIRFDLNDPADLTAASCQYDVLLVHSHGPGAALEPAIISGVPEWSAAVGGC